MAYNKPTIKDTVGVGAGGLGSTCYKAPAKNQSK